LPFALCSTKQLGPIFGAFQTENDAALHFPLPLREGANHLAQPSDLGEGQQFTPTHFIRVVANEMPSPVKGEGNIN
jgi:hypothetical protein